MLDERIPEKYEDKLLLFSYYCSRAAEVENELEVITDVINKLPKVEGKKAINELRKIKFQRSKLKRELEFLEEKIIPELCHQLQGMMN